MSFTNIIYMSVCTVIATFFATFALFNVVADFGTLGSFGAKFLYEMNEVMGSLIGIPHYSKLEAIILSVASFGLFSGSWFGHNQMLFLGSIVGVAYMVNCTVYAHLVGLSVSLFMIIAGGCGVLGAMTYRFLTEGEEKENASQVLAFAGTFIVVSSVIMVVRSKGRESFHERFHKINKYCDKNPNFVWKLGSDKPEGFEELKAD